MNKYYWSRQSVFSFIEPLSINDIKQLTNLDKYMLLHLKSTTQKHKHSMYVYLCTCTLKSYIDTDEL